MSETVRGPDGRGAVTTVDPGPFVMREARAC